MAPPKAGWFCNIADGIGNICSLNKNFIVIISGNGAIVALAYKSKNCIAIYL